MEITGTILMAILLTVSNAGGLSGAGSNIPIMLIFFGLDMSEAVPISAFVAVTATLFRFLINYNKVHPNRPERNVINYEVVRVTMPCVFLGSFFGVILGKMIGETAQVIIFGLTVTWSIKTTGQKALQLLKEERAAEKDVGATPEDALMEKAEEMEGGEDPDEKETETPELLEIKNEEKNHFTLSRVLFILVNFTALYTTQVLYKSAWMTDLNKKLVLAAFTALMLTLTYLSVKKINKIHEIKKRDNYRFDKNDLEFKTFGDIAKLSFFCMIAAILCGCTGIAGGMVLGPLFLSYNMLPQIMSGTNQYITMIASISVAVQFFQLGELNMNYALMFGVITIICAFVGIQAINMYVARSGKQSIIAILLTVVLIMAVVSLPINYIIKANAQAATAAEPAGDVGQPAEAPVQETQ